MYVIVDWHILEDNDPNFNIDEAKAFFEMISSEYSSVPNIIYEICNEPNGDTDWNDVYEHSEQIIKIIRNNSTDSLILVGTPDYDRNLAPCVRKPLPYDNVMTENIYRFSSTEFLHYRKLLLEITTLFHI